MRIVGGALEWACAAPSLYLGRGRSCTEMHRSNCVSHVMQPSALTNIYGKCGLEERRELAESGDSGASVELQCGPVPGMGHGMGPVSGMCPIY